MYKYARKVSGEREGERDRGRDRVKEGESMGESLTEEVRDRQKQILIWREGGTEGEGGSDHMDGRIDLTREHKREREREN